MGVSNWKDLIKHYGHDIHVVTYGPNYPVNVAVECEDCSEVILDYEIENEDENIRLCTKCGAATTHERRTEDLPIEGDNCDLCGEWICVDCTAYTYMAVEKTENPVCIYCADEETKEG